ncbi:MAG: hypothetical protein JWM74_3119 [Myxococcaceae bacterium]|nr:hypothetical protein [Myxococcaceae bacterium]
MVGAALALALSGCSDGAPVAQGAETSPRTRTGLAGEGETIVRMRGCPTCHQSAEPGAGLLSGQTTPLAGTMAYPANLTADAETGIGGLRDDQIETAITSSRDERYGSLCTMPKFALTIGELQAVVAYLRSLPPVHRAIPRSACAEKPEE